MRIQSGDTTSAIYFVAVDATDLKTRETGLSGFTVYRSRSGGAGVAMVSPTVTEIDSANMPGVYSLLLDEDTSVSARATEELCIHITKSGMAPVTRVVEIFPAPVIAVRQEVAIAEAVWKRFNRPKFR